MGEALSRCEEALLFKTGAKRAVGRRQSWWLAMKGLLMTTSTLTVGYTNHAQQPNWRHMGNLHIFSVEPMLRPRWKQAH